MDIQEAIRNLLLKVISSKADDALRYSEAILNLVRAQKVQDSSESNKPAIDEVKK